MIPCIDLPLSYNPFRHHLALGSVNNLIVHVKPSRRILQVFAAFGHKCMILLFQDLEHILCLVLRAWLLSVGQFVQSCDCNDGLQS